MDEKWRNDMSLMERRIENIMKAMKIAKDYEMKSIHISDGVFRKRNLAGAFHSALFFYLSQRIKLCYFFKFRFPSQ